jgi:putative transposase
MPRTARALLAGGFYHLINRGNNRAAIFPGPGDYQAFLSLVAKAQQRIPLSIVAFCAMPNHFHVVASSSGARDISRWMQWLLTTHGHRFHLAHATSGRVWQGRFKAFPIQHDAHLLTVMRYVERNALRAGLVSRAEEWPWGSLAWRTARYGGPRLAESPVPVPVNWVSLVNTPQTPDELQALRTCVNRQRPFGDERWSEDAAARLGLSASRRARGRPRRPADQDGLPLT